MYHYLSRFNRTCCCVKPIDLLFCLRRPHQISLLLTY